jgi:DNA-binding response OmpR family regulator
MTIIAQLTTEVLRQNDFQVISFSDARVALSWLEKILLILL